MSALLNSHSVGIKVVLIHCAESTGIAGKGKAVFHNGNKIFPFNKELPPEKLK